MVVFGVFFFSEVFHASEEEMVCAEESVEVGSEVFLYVWDFLDERDDELCVDSDFVCLVVV